MNPEAILALLSDLRVEIARLRSVVAERDATIAQLEAKPARQRTKSPDTKGT